jgi:hypothetical protein
MEARSGNKGDTRRYITPDKKPVSAALDPGIPLPLVNVEKVVASATPASRIG